MKRNKKNMRAAYIFIAIIFGISIILNLIFNIRFEIMKIGIVVFGLIFLFFCIVFEINEESKYNKKMDNILWNESEQRQGQNIYENLCKNYAESIDCVWKKTAVQFWLVNILLLISLWICWKVENFKYIFFIISLYALAIIIIVILNIIGKNKYYNKILKEFIEISNRDTFKLKYIDLMEKEEYINFYGMMKEEYKSFNDYADFLTLKDCISGYVADNIEVKLAKVHSTENTFNSSKICRIFDGVYAVMDKYTDIKFKMIFDKNVNYYNEEEEINLNNETFKKYLNVYSTDKEKTIKFLNEELLNYIMEFIEKYSIKIELLLDGKVYIKFYTKELFNRAKMHGSEIDKTSSIQYYAMIEFMEKLVKFIDK